MDKILKVLDKIYKECQRKTVRVNVIRQLVAEASIYVRAYKKLLDNSKLVSKEENNDGKNQESSEEVSEEQSEEKPKES